MRVKLAVNGTVLKWKMNLQKWKASGNHNFLDNEEFTSDTDR
jgi:hypothetical protein